MKGGRRNERHREALRLQDCRVVMRGDTLWSTRRVTVVYSLVCTRCPAERAPLPCAAAWAEGLSCVSGEWGLPAVGTGVDRGAIGPESADTVIIIDDSCQHLVSLMWACPFTNTFTLMIY